MQKLLIKLCNENAVCLCTILCSGLDASKHSTILSESVVRYKDKPSSEFINHYAIPEEIDHFNIIEGMITLYYRNGFYLEISRVNHA